MEAVSLLHESFLPEVVAPLEYLGEICSYAELLPHTEVAAPTPPSGSGCPHGIVCLCQQHCTAQVGAFLAFSVVQILIVLGLRSAGFGGGSGLCTGVKSGCKAAYQDDAGRTRWRSLA